MTVMEEAYYFNLVSGGKLARLSAFAQSTSGNRRKTEIKNGGRRPKQNEDKRFPWALWKIMTNHGENETGGM